MSKEMNGTITAFSLYTYACNNIYNIKNILLNKEKNLTLESSINNSMESSKNLSESLITDDEFDETFEISVSKEEFDGIIEERLQKRTGRNFNKKVSYRRNLRFRSGIYQEFFAKLFWKTRRLQSCAINYINHYIPKDVSGGYLNGYCRCGSIIQIKFELRDCDNVILLCSFKKGKKTKKCGPLYLRGETRKTMVKKLKTTNVYTYRATQAADLMRLGDPICPLIRSGNVLHVAQNEETCINLHSNPIQALVIMKNMTKYSNCIGNIGLDPFYVHYCVNLQVQIYKKLSSKYKNNLEIYIDATGARFKEIMTCDGKKTAYILLYLIVVNVEEGQFPIAQMITEQHSVSSIQHWLNEWLSLKIPLPKQICVDYSFALLHAIARTFDGCYNIYDYANKCKNNIPRCYIRIDRAHFIKKYTRLLKSSTKILKTFYASCIGALCNCKDELEARKIIKAILTLSQQETEIDKFKEREQYLKSIITGTIKDEVENIMNIKDECNIDDFKEDIMYTETTSNNWKKWVEVIAKEIEKESENETDRPNAYRNIQLAKILKKDIYLLPLWTKLLENKIGYGSMGGSKASCEGEINKIKNIVFKDIKNKTIKVDSFVQRHIDHLFGEMLLANANSKIETHNLDETGLHISQELQEKENWKGKIVKKFKTSNINSKNSCSTFIDSDKDNIEEKCEDAEPIITPLRKNEENENNILKNILNKPSSKKKLPLYLGYQTEHISQKLQYKQPNEVSIFKHCSNIHLTAHKIDGISYSLINSCPFDSLIQILYVIGTDDENVKKMINTIEDNEFFDTVKYLFKYGITNEVYKRRTTLMTTHGKILAYNQRLQQITLDCEGNMGEMSLKLIGNAFYSLEYVDYCKKQCNEAMTHQCKMLLIKETELRKENIHLNEIEEAFPKKRKCHICQETNIREFCKLNNLVIIEVATSKNYFIEEIPKYLTNKENEKRQLCGIIRYIGTIGKMGHYTALCQRPNGKWEEFDGLAKNKNIRKVNDKKIIPSILFYK